MPEPPTDSCSQPGSSTFEFIQQIKERVARGEGFVPFIGSGASAPSGILTGQQFTGLLLYTCHLCATGKRDLRAEGWPPPPTPEEAEAAGQWSKARGWDSLATLHARRVLRRNDWRATLHFLSRLERRNGKVHVQRRGNPAVIDSFNAHITRGRKPNFIHTMLCHLAGPARFHIFLTTNFDTLLEDSFEDSPEPLQVISVSSRGALPAPDLVRARDTLVKMHGTQWETRADFSLDHKPPAHDRDTFLSYFRGNHPGSDGKFLPAHLLVCGYSGSDRRCMDLMRHVLDQWKEARIFWICHTEKDRAWVKKELAGSPSKRTSDRAQRVITTVTPRTDLLLYELYQHLSLSLPRGGLSYQYSASVPPWPLDQLGENLPDNPRLEKLDQWLATQRPESRIALVHGGPGVLPLLRSFLRQQSSAKFSHQAVWLEMEDYPDTCCLAFDLLQILSVRLGLFQRTHADLLPASFRPKTLHRAEDWKNHLEHLAARYLHIDPAGWIIVLYGRSAPGTCGGWEYGEAWDIEEYKAFRAFLDGLRLAGFRVVYAPYCPRRDQEAYRPGHPTDEPDHYREIADLIELGPLGNTPDVFKSAREAITNWLGNNNAAGLRRRAQALYACSLFRKSRHYSAFLGESIFPVTHRYNALGIDNNWERDQEVEALRRQLMRRAPLFYEKPGGFAWMYADHRGLARDEAAKAFPGITDQHGELNYWIADWYMRAYHTTGHAVPLVEALFHYCESLGSTPSAAGSHQQFKVWRRGMCGITRALRTGEESLRLWLGEAELEILFQKIPVQDPPSFDQRPHPAVGPIIDDLNAILAAYAQRLSPSNRPFTGSLASGPRPVSSYKLFVVPRHNPGDQNEARDPFLDELNDDDLNLKGSPPYVQHFAECAWKNLDDNFDQVDDDIRDWQEEKQTYFEYDAVIYSQMQQLNEWAFLFGRRAKLRQLVAAYPREGGSMEERPLLGLDKEARMLWKAAMVLCNVSLQYSRVLHPNLRAAEESERVKSLTLYGMALARLGRFHEAHRRLNEANALLSKSVIPDRDILLGILKLRRGEAHTLESILVANLKADCAPFDSAHLHRRYALISGPDREEARRDLSVAKLDDAWCSLETAEHLMSGRLNSARWWARLKALKLRCLAELPPSDSKLSKRLSLISRLPAAPPERIHTLLESGLASSLGHHTLRLRLVDYALRASKRLCPKNGEVAKLIEQRGAEVLGAIPKGTVKNTTMTRYANLIRATLESNRHAP